MKVIRGLTIDPGTHQIGYTFFEWEAPRLTLLEYGSFKASAHKPLEIRLHQIYYQARRWMENRFDHLVTERSMSNKKFPGGGETVRESLGVLKVAAVDHGMEVTSLRPSDAKWAVTGKIAASKLEVAEAVAALGIVLPMTPDILIAKKQDHITDAIALTIAFAFTQTTSIELFDMKGEFLCGLSKPEPAKTKKKKKNSDTSSGKPRTRKTTTSEPRTAKPRKSKQDSAAEDTANTKKTVKRKSKVAESA